MKTRTNTALVLAIAAALGAQTVAAETFSVSNTNDSGPGSLRQALADAQANGEADIIELSAISGQTINLTSGQLEIEADDITIQGNDVTLDAGGNSRVFLISSQSDVELSDLSVTGGDATKNEEAFGGGIRVQQSDVSFARLRVFNNQAGNGGGVQISGDGIEAELEGINIYDNVALGGYGGGLILNVENSDITIHSIEVHANQSIEYEIPLGLSSENRFNERGAAPFSPFIGGMGVAAEGSSSVVMEDLSIENNVADKEGGFLLLALDSANIEISNFTVSGNQAQIDRGGLYVSADDYSTVQINNFTVSSNDARFFPGMIAIARDDAIIDLGSATITNNQKTTSSGGTDALGLEAFSESNGLIISTSVIAGNGSFYENDLVINASKGTAIIRYSLIGSQNLFGSISTDATTDALTGLNALLGPLADNGGPTRTHLPFTASPLIDAVLFGQAGCGTTLTTDQRGEVRPLDGACDIGSVESRGVPQSVPVPVLSSMGLLLMAGLLGLAGVLGLRRLGSDKHL